MGTPGGQRAAAQYMLVSLPPFDLSFREQSRWKEKGKEADRKERSEGERQEGKKEGIERWWRSQGGPDAEGVW